MSTVNHWGKWVNSEEPVTGVLSINSIDWDSYPFREETCLDCEAARKEEERINPLYPDYDYIECNSSHTKLIGDWTLDTKTGQYSADKSGEYAAIVNESTIQVVFSKTTKRGALCSPCYPGQVDLDSTGEFLGYTLPEDMLYKTEYRL